MTAMTIVIKDSRYQNNETLPIYTSSFIKALCINLPVCLILAKNPILGVIGSTVGYASRLYCNDYLKDHLDSDDSFQYMLKAAVCGGIGGSLKYAILSTSLDPSKLALGAINNFLYEATGPSKFCHKDDILCHFAVAANMEGLEGLFKNYIKLFNNEELSIAPVLDGIWFGVLLTAFSYLTGYSGSSTDNSYEAAISGDGINNTPLQLIEFPDNFMQVS
jgi:hypothetical protein